MARAKRTDRAEARRRYRARLATEGAVETVDSAASERAKTSGDGRAQTGAVREQRADTAPTRPSIGYAFRAAYRPANLREDLRYLPTLVLRTKAVWLPALLSIASGALLVASPSDLTLLVFQYFVYTPPVGALFIAGFLAPRASYLAGILVAVVAAGVFAAILPTGVLDPYFPDADLSSPAVQGGILTQALVFGGLLGAFVAAASAWYKRFLRLLNPNRGRTQGRQARGRKGSRRR